MTLFSLLLFYFLILNFLLVFIRLYSRNIMTLQFYFRNITLFLYYYDDYSRNIIIIYIFYP